MREKTYGLKMPGLKRGTSSMIPGFMALISSMRWNIQNWTSVAGDLMRSLTAGPISIRLSSTRNTSA